METFRTHIETLKQLFILVMLESSLKLVTKNKVQFIAVVVVPIYHKQSVLVCPPIFLSYILSLLRFIQFTYLHKNPINASDYIGSAIEPNNVNLRISYILETRDNRRDFGGYWTKSLLIISVCQPFCLCLFQNR